MPYIWYYVDVIGIGQGRVTNNLKGAPIDYAMVVSDEEAVSMVCNTMHVCY